MSKKIGILTGGGDCPGLNPAIRGVVLRAVDYKLEVIGFLEGWRGVIEQLTQPLGLTDVDEIGYRGGTILGTSRVNPYKKPADVDKVKNTFRKFGLTALIAMGGEDTLGVTNKLYNEFKLPMIGVPKTMDNDLSATDYTFGFDSSATKAVEALDGLRDTGRSHRRVMILEVMGRHAGWVALFAGLAGGADWILIPEREPDIEAMCGHLKKVHQRKKYALVVTSEGVKIPGMEVAKEQLDQFGHMILRKRGVGEDLAKLIKDKTGLETRASVIGHMQRGGAPTLFDRMLGLRTGVKAVDLVQEAKFGRMVALRGNEIVDVPLAEAVGKLKTVDDKWWNLAKVFFK